MTEGCGENLLDFLSPFDAHLITSSPSWGMGVGGGGWGVGGGGGESQT